MRGAEGCIRGEEEMNERGGGDALGWGGVGMWTDVDGMWTGCGRDVGGMWAGCGAQGPERAGKGCNRAERKAQHGARQ